MKNDNAAQNKMDVGNNKTQKIRF